MPLKFLTTPPPSTVLLPDTQFFVRSIPVPDDATRADVATQIELALESTAPFPLTQMYYGHHWLPGAKHALAYAAYRKRFNPSTLENWPAADAVLPAFVPYLAPDARPATTTIIHTPTSVTAIHYTDATGVPTQVQTRALPQQTTPEDPPVTDEQLAAARTAARDELIHAAHGTAHLHEYTHPETLAPARAPKGLAFTLTPDRPPNAPAPAPRAHTFTREQLDALDVRDKTELAERRSTRRRDLLLWRAFLAGIALLVVCGLTEIAVLVGKKMEQKRTTQVALQAPFVAEIEKKASLANRIEDLSTKRLLPFEMIDLIRPTIPPSVLFTRVTTGGANRSITSIDIQAKTTVARDFDSFRTALINLPNMQKVTVTNSTIKDGNTTFTLAIDFKPGTVKPAVDEPPPKPPEPPPAAPQAEEPADNQPPSIREQIQQQTAPPDAHPGDAPAHPPPQQSPPPASQGQPPPPHPDESSYEEL